ncbi:hypothetical protein M514_28065 [Trichuris suis]|uniref:Uncharacterized protein n=1 Tax=Trichuris suis TaxID=68888 RepID=A0A085MRA7_9BILA|nr:hypothetical protein M514_28065 [Trichuris suis]
MAVDNCCLAICHVFIHFTQQGYLVLSFSELVFTQIVIKSWQLLWLLLLMPNLFQRLSASGYCFSASLPSPLTAGALRGLEIMIEDPERLSRLRRNSCIFHKAMQNLNRFKVDGVAGSPLFHLRVPPGQDDERLLDTLIEKAMNEGILLTKMSMLKDQEWFYVPESVKISLSSEHTMEEIERLLIVIDSVDKA